MMWLRTIVLELKRGNMIEGNIHQFSGGLIEDKF